jgi:hypothetical protein
MMGIMKAELCKQIWKKIYMGQLEWTGSQMMKMTQIKDNKSPSIKVTRRSRKNGGPIFQNR